jgi:hypothetical protein
MWWTTRNRDSTCLKSYRPENTSSLQIFRAKRWSSCTRNWKSITKLLATDWLLDSKSTRTLNLRNTSTLSCETGSSSKPKMFKFYPCFSKNNSRVSNICNSLRLCKSSNKTIRRLSAFFRWMSWRNSGPCPTANRNRSCLITCSRASLTILRA